MNYQLFRDELHKFKIFSLTDIKKIFPVFDTRRLVEWQEKGYIKKVINRWYVFSDVTVEDSFLYWSANRIYRHSYISMETALSYYGLIPEAVYTTTSVSTLKTASFDTPLGTFAYRHVKQALFFGYRVMEWQKFPIKMAEPEKLILDYLYLNPRLNQHEDWQGLRLNQEIMHDMVDAQKLQKYLTIFQSGALDKRVSNFLKFMELC
ncbi:MAG: type IV toxin-antitoxin system AbiEi family antitoxin domain-containing protein [Cyclobacteriaceae bacterium]